MKGIIDWFITQTYLPYLYIWFPITVDCVGWDTLTGFITKYSSTGKFNVIAKNSGNVFLIGNYNGSTYNCYKVSLTQQE